MKGYWSTVLAGASAIAALLVALPAAADQAEDMHACANSNSSVSTQDQIDACTRTLQSGLTADMMVDVHLIRAGAYMQLKEYQPAIEDLDAVVGAGEVNKESLPTALMIRGTAYAALKQYRPAMRDFDRSLALKPDASTFNNRAFAYVEQGQYRRAIGDCDQAITLQSDFASAFFIRGVARLRTGDAVGGHADIAKAKSITPAIAEQYAVYGLKP